MDSDDDSDDWATEDLPPLPKASGASSSDARGVAAEDAEDDMYWEVEKNTQPPTGAEDHQPPKKEQEEEGHPMLLVDMTILSNGEIHSKFDPNAVNDPVAVKKLRNEIDFATYASDATLLANRTVVPCGSTVWRAALVSLRKETSGHYWCPIFPPK